MLLSVQAVAEYNVAKLRNTGEAICGGPPSLLVAVMVRFDKYRGPTLHDGSVPIVPQRRTWVQRGSACSRLQIPLKLSWTITIHKAQGITLDKVTIDIGKKELT